MSESSDVLYQKIHAQVTKAKEASRKLAFTSTEDKNNALLAMAELLHHKKADVLKENAKDLVAAKERGIKEAMLDRLTLTEARIEGMAQGLVDVVQQKDPVGEIVKGWKRPNGLLITQVRTPIGVVAMVYEARPNVTVDAAGLALKSGNACVLRGGSEAIHSNIAIARVLDEALQKAGLPEGSVTLIETTDREAVQHLLKMSDQIDLVIPRGGENLIRTVVENSTIPVLKHFKGLCHIYVDKAADIEMAVQVANNAKTQRPSVCNAMESLLVHKDVADQFLPKFIDGLSKPLELRGCPDTVAILNGKGNVVAASEEDYSTEYLDYILSVKVVSGLDEAVNRIAKYSSGLAEAIITNDHASATRFTNEVDSAAVYVNTSTRFTDGAEYGLGAEVGITTDKVFPRGPMGLEALTSTKYVVYGSGQIRQ